MTKPRVTHGLIAAVTLLSGMAFFVEKSAWGIIFHYRAAHAVDCACAVVGISTWQQWAVLGLGALFFTGILAGLWYMASTLIRTRRFIARIKGGAQEMSYAGVSILKFKGGPCHAFTFGFWHPRIAVCAHCYLALPAQEFSAMVEHERHHAENRDPLKLFLVDAAKYLFFFVPLMHTLARFYHMVAELDADAQVGNRQALGSALLKIAGTSSVVNGFTASFASMLSVRIERIVNPAAVISLPRKRVVILGTLLLVTGTIGVIQQFPSAVAVSSAPCLRQVKSCQNNAPVDTKSSVYYNGIQ